MSALAMYLRNVQIAAEAREEGAAGARAPNFEVGQCLSNFQSNQIYLTTQKSKINKQMKMKK